MLHQRSSSAPSPEQTSTFTPSFPQPSHCGAGCPCRHSLPTPTQPSKQLWRPGHGPLSKPHPTHDANDIFKLNSLFFFFIVLCKSQQFGQQSTTAVSTLLHCTVEIPAVWATVHHSSLHTSSLYCGNPRSLGNIPQQQSPHFFIVLWESQKFGQQSNTAVSTLLLPCPAHACLCCAISLYTCRGPHTIM